MGFGRRLRSTVIVLGAAASLVMVLAGAAQATGTRVVSLSFQPPAADASTSTSTSTANLTQDWHTSSLAGDTSSCSGSCTCSPTPTYCEALDWNKGSGSFVGEPVYFRAYGYYSGGTTTGLIYATIVGHSGTCSLESKTYPNEPTVKLHWVDIIIKRFSDNAVIGTNRFQHFTPSTSSVTITLSPGGSYNNIKIGTTTWETTTGTSTGSKNRNCWTGDHVHEDTLHDSTTSHQLGAWLFNGSYYQGRSGAVSVTSTSHWTRQLTWEF